MVNIINIKDRIDGDLWFSEVVKELNSANSDFEDLRKLIESVSPTLDGWCAKEKAIYLIAVILSKKPKVVVEIGVFGGSSFIPMALALNLIGTGEIYGIDPWSSSSSSEGMEGENLEWWSSLDHEQIYKRFLQSLNRYGLGDAAWINLCRMTSTQAIGKFSEIDVLHIDGNHSVEQSLFDAQRYCPLVSRNGIIIFDDYQQFYTQAASDWMDKHYQVLFDIDTSRFYRPKG
jgi:predicted O-methyltransferase YrrM